MIFNKKIIFLILFIFIPIFCVFIFFTNGVRITWVNEFPSKEVITHASDGMPLRFSLWRKNKISNGNEIAILFVHGLTEKGLKAPQYSLLCKNLADRGFIVAAPWLRGHEGAFKPGSQFISSRWNPIPDIEGVFLFLKNELNLDPSNIYVLGHSSGGGYALLFGLSFPKLGGIISMSRLDLETRFNKLPGYFEKSRHWRSKAFGFQKPIPAKMYWEFVETNLFAFKIAEGLITNNSHPPILFAIGGDEASSDRNWLRNYAKEAIGTVEYYEFPGLDHFLNVKGNRKGDFVLYNKKSIEKVGNKFAHWIEKQRNQQIIK